MSAALPQRVVTPDEQFSIEQFYYYEARLLDGRQFKTWLTLLDPGIQYLMPSRVNTLVNNRDKGNESMLGIERELEGTESMGCPLREENIIHLTLRAERGYMINAWAENPPARTRRIIGNVEVLESSAECYEVISNFHLYFSRPSSADFIYSGQRSDRLLKHADGFRLQRREVIMDYALVEVPTMGLIF